MDWGWRVTTTAHWELFDYPHGPKSSVISYRFKIGIIAKIFLICFQQRTRDLNSKMITVMELRQVFGFSAMARLH
jgi:hypothetical protein